MSYTYTYRITLEHIFISPGHNYFSRPKEGPGDHPTVDVEEVTACAGLGLMGDRYFGVAAHFDAQVSLIAGEVLDALAEALALDALFPGATRRNIVTRGVNLNRLIGQEFAIEGPVEAPNGARSGVRSETVHLLGAKACSPCAWMDAAFGDGAHAFLRGRGGLRARILTDGILYRGPALLHTEIEPNPTTIVERIARPRLP